MTTIDPGLVKQQRAQRPPSAGGVLLSLIAIVVGSAAFTWGLVGSIDPIPSGEMALIVGTMTGGITMLIIGVTGWTMAVLRESVSRSLRNERPGSRPPRWSPTRAMTPSRWAPRTSSPR